MKKWFTLIELVVVIVILSIVWLIAFLRLWDFIDKSKSSRVLTDLSTISSALVLHSSTPVWVSNRQLNLPNPDWYTKVSANWHLLWRQWNLWPLAISNLTTLNSIPLDPWLNEPYTYSVTKDWKRFQVASIWLKSIVSRPYFDSVYAQSFVSNVRWNYDNKIIVVKTWSNYYVYPSPSIIIDEPVSTLSSNTRFVVDSCYNYLNKYNSIVWASLWNEINPVFTWALSSAYLDNNDNINSLLSTINWILWWYQSWLWCADIVLSEAELRNALWRAWLPSLLVGPIITPPTPEPTPPVLTWCWIDLYLSWSPSSCVFVWVWYYSPVDNDNIFTCTNKPSDNYQYISSWVWTNNCSFACVSWFSWLNCSIVSYYPSSSYPLNFDIDPFKEDNPPSGSWNTTYQVALDYCATSTKWWHSDWVLPTQSQLNDIRLSKDQYPALNNNHHYWFLGENSMQFNNWNISSSSPTNNVICIRTP